MFDRSHLTFTVTSIQIKPGLLQFCGSASHWSAPLHIDADPLDIDTGPDRSFQFKADPDPTFRFDAHPYPVLFSCKSISGFVLMRTRIRLCFCADPNPSQSNANLQHWPTVQTLYTTASKQVFMAPRWASKNDSDPIPQNWPTEE